MRWLELCLSGLLAAAQAAPTFAAGRYLDNDKVVLLDSVPCPPVGADPSCVEIKVTGTAGFDCAVRADGTLHDCVIFHERPRGRGLKKRVLALSKRIRLAPLTTDGQPVAGRRYRLTYSFLAPHGD